MADKEASAAAAPEKKPKTVLIIIIAVVVSLALGGALVFFLMPSPPPAAVAAEGVAAPVAATNTSKKNALYFQLRPAFVVNFLVNGQQQYLQVEFTAVTSDDAVIDALKTHLPVIRNNLIMLLGAQDYKDLATTAGKEALRVSALSEVQGILRERIGQDGVDQVLLTEFVLQ